MPADDEAAIPLTEVPAHLPRRRGKKVHYSTVYRWATKGARGRVLESRLVGGVRYTTIGALRAFTRSADSTAADEERAEAIRRALYGGAGRPSA